MTDIIDKVESDESARLTCLRLKQLSFPHGRITFRFFCVFFRIILSRRISFLLFIISLCKSIVLDKSSSSLSALFVFNIVFQPRKLLTKILNYLFKFSIAQTSIRISSTSIEAARYSLNISTKILKRKRHPFSINLVDYPSY